MRAARAFLVTLCFAAFVCLSGSATPSLAVERRPSAETAERVHGSKHYEGRGRGVMQDRAAGRVLAKPSAPYFLSGGHNPTVIGGPYRPNRNVAVWGQPLKATHSTAAVGGTARNHGRY
jgi:hypothetical protein